MLAALVVVLCVVARLLPQPANFTPIGAAAVLAGRTLPRRYSIALMMVTMLASDLVLSRLRGMSYLNAVTPFVYAGFAAQVLLGAWTVVLSLAYRPWARLLSTRGSLWVPVSDAKLL